VLDTGSSNFIPMVNYLKGNGVLRVFSELGRHVVIHSVLVGGAGARETLAGLAGTVETLEAAGYVAWLNSFFGPVIFDGKPFEETKAFGEIKDRLTGIVRIKERAGTHQVAEPERIARDDAPSPDLQGGDGYGGVLAVGSGSALIEVQREINNQLIAIFGCVEPVAAHVG